MSSSGTGKHTLGILYVKGQKIPVTSLGWKDDSEIVEHRATDSHNVLGHSDGDKKYSCDLEKEIKDGDAPFDPTEFNASNPVDVVIVEPNQRIRLVQGVTTPGTTREMKTSGGWTCKWSMGMFKDKRIE